MMKKTVFTISLVAIIGFIIKPVLKLNIIEWTNILFIISIISFLFAACMYITASGFLDFFLLGFTRLNNAIFRKPRALVRIDENSKHSAEIANFKTKMYKIVLQQSLAIGFCTLLISIIGLYLT